MEGLTVLLRSPGILFDHSVRRLRFYEDELFEFPQSERGVLPGAPPTPQHPTSRRLIYAFTSLLVGLTGALGNGIVIANLPYLQGALGLYLSEIAWLPTAYFVTNAITGFILVKYRQQFGVRSFCIIFLALQVMLIGAHLAVQGLASAIIVRAGSGICGAALTSLCVFYMIQAMPPTHRLKAVALGIGIPQLAVPLARLLPKDLLAFSNWNGLYLFELGLSLLTLAAVMLVRLPSNKREKAFEGLDVISFLLYATGVALLGSGIGLGSYLWWTNESWIGWCLAASLPCLAAVICLEYFRQTPLIDVRWLSAPVFLRWAFVSILCRVALSEQSVGAIGLLRDFGLTNDDIQSLSLVILAAASAGVIAGALAVSPSRLAHLVMISAALIAIAALMDSRSNLETRAAQLVVSQAMIAFATTVFIGPSFIFGLSRVIADGGKRMTSFIALFGAVQSIGSLIGTSFIQSCLYYAQQWHLADFAAQVEKVDPLVANAAALLGSQYAPILQDPRLRSAEGVASLSSRLLLSARIAGYNDVFFLVSAIATLAAAILLLVIVFNRPWPLPFQRPTP